MPKSILIVDDDPTLTKMLASVLMEEGYSPSVANDGEKGLEMLREIKPDLVILDIEMPKVDGYGFLSEMRVIDGLKNVPVIVLTSKEEMEELFKIEGAKEYLVKPYHNNNLLEKIKKYV